MELDAKKDAVYNNRGLAYMELDRYDQAQADFIQAIALNDKMDVYYYNLGLIQYTQGEYEDALKNYNKAIELKRGRLILFQQSETV
mgnify:CR=1 FL=1